ncbi:linear amide C-N hydrolase [Persicobacter diffluens]|uniref:Hydrolase n=1 Tax=Persicobacter diffluens TaxID=981 RepID=A0AAN4W580_9BACT|nr:hydrolase [Persicobacter diffluens]
MCTRILYKTGYESYMVGRTMDWNDPAIPVSFYVFPRGYQQNGGAGKNPIEWTSRYGSLIVSGYEAGTNEGFNEKGLVVNTLYLAESDYGNEDERGKPTISVGAWAQYVLDNFATVQEAVKAQAEDPFTVVSPVLPNGRQASMHLSVSDPSGDSAIFEFIEGKIVISHSKDYTVMTNSPTFDQQLAIDAYWKTVGGTKFLPGTINAADRFARASFNLSASPQYKTKPLALASVWSQVRAISTPLGLEDPDHPNISMTVWRSVLDHQDLVYYFENPLMGGMIELDLKRIDFSPGSGVRKLATGKNLKMQGDVTDRLQPATAFEFMS